MSSSTDQKGGAALLLMLCLGLPAAGCSLTPAVQSCDQSAAAVGRAAEYLIARDNARDLDGVLAGYTDDVSWFPPHDPPLHGIEAIRPRYEDLFSKFTVALRSEVLEASGSGESGFIIGTNHGTLTPIAGGQTVTVNDRFVSIVRCVGGEWKVSHLIWGPR